MRCNVAGLLALFLFGCGVAPQVLDDAGRPCRADELGTVALEVHCPDASIHDQVFREYHRQVGREAPDAEVITWALTNTSQMFLIEPGHAWVVYHGPSGRSGLAALLPGSVMFGTDRNNPDHLGKIVERETDTVTHERLYRAGPATIARLEAAIAQAKREGVVFNPMGIQDTQHCVTFACGLIEAAGLTPPSWEGDRDAWHLCHGAGLAPVAPTPGGKD